MRSGVVKVTLAPILTSGERRLVDAAANGDLADFSATDLAENDPARGHSWGDQRTLSAQVVRALATGSNPSWKTASSGLRIAGAKITGLLDLADAKIRFPMAFIGCCFDREPSLRNASVKSIFLGGRTLPRLH